MFKKRKLNLDVLGGFNPFKVLFCRSSEDGKRQLLNLSPDEFRQLNPIDFTDFSLTEEMAAGVNLRELPASNVLNASPDMSDEQILEALEAQNVEPKN